MAATRMDAHHQRFSTRSDESEKPVTSDTPRPNHHRWPFWRHFLQMLAVMVIGMLAAAAILTAAAGVRSWDELTTQYPTQSLLGMAAGMTLPMAAWMLYRGMGWKNTGEMAAVMVLPVIPFLCLVWFEITKSAQCGAYCAVSVVAMLALMGYRHGEYSMEM